MSSVNLSLTCSLDARQSRSWLHNLATNSRVLRWIAVAPLLAVICLIAATSPAQEVTPADIEQWLKTYAQATPQFKPGDVLQAKDLDRLRPFLPPGYIAELKNADFKMKIIATRDHRPRRDYLDCTEKYQAQVRLKNDGTLANHICGQPFADSTLAVGDPISGLKAVWNFEMRWQNYGAFSLLSFYLPMRLEGTHSLEALGQIEMPPPSWLEGIQLRTPLPTSLADIVEGNVGSVRRSMSASYQRLYFTHLAQRAANGGVLDQPNAANFFFKEFNGFVSPYDVRGEVFISHRYSDFHRKDDAWIYDPHIRRVRRFSAEEKSDSFMGTDETLDDFYTFSGHLLDWNWRFLGWKDLLCVMDSEHSYSTTRGPLPDDRWSVRRFAVVERIPKDPTNPYGKVITFWDAETWMPWMALAFDRNGKLWRAHTKLSAWSEDMKQWGEINHGVDAATQLGGQYADVQHARYSLWVALGSGYPPIDHDRAEKLFDPSNLEQIHR